jgi:hypothetical protein
MDPAGEKYATPIQFCPECGHRILEGRSDNKHEACIAWGRMMNKYRDTVDWVAACLKNGQRVLEIIKL